MRADRSAPLMLNSWLRYDVIERLLPAGVTDVLEVGCGQGAVAVRLAHRYRYLGLEPDATSYAVARDRIAAEGRGEVRPIAVESLPPADFDLVCAFEVLEHIEDDVAAVRDWVARLRPGGWLLLSVPAHQHRYGPFDQLVGHHRRYDPAGITALLHGAGLTEVRVRQYGMPLGYLLEAGRNAIGRRRLGTVAGQSTVERTAGSGRLLQGKAPWLGTATRLGTWPFRQAQRAFPGTGTGLVVRARRPAAIR